MTWTAWSLLTPAQQAAIPKALITDVPNVSGTISTEVFKKLWTNSSPTADFAAQTITLASDDYDFLFFDYAYTANGRRFTSIISKGCNGIINVAIQASDTVFGDPMRTVTYNTATSISIGDCSYQSIQNSGAVGTATNNSILIPIAIYGFKKSVSFDLTTLVADVSTSANKCMLSDGITSVENALASKSQIKFRVITGTTDATANLVFSDLNMLNSYVLSASGTMEGTGTDLTYLIGGIPMVNAGGNWFIHVFDYAGTERASANISLKVAYIEL